MALKTLHFDTFFNTAVPVSVHMTLSDLYHPRTSFLIQLLDGSWVQYQFSNQELIRGRTLQELLDKSYEIDTKHFLEYFAYEPTESELEVIKDVFSYNDNFNIGKTIYMIR